MEAERPVACYRDRNNGVLFTKGTHRLDCNEDCRGCKPCLERWHCTARANCTWHVEAGDLTCGRCLAGVRRHLRRIVDLAALMLTMAIGEGVNSEAAMLAGPATNPVGWSERRVAMLRHLDAWTKSGFITEPQHEHALTTLPNDDQRHPYSVLTRWQMMLSEDYGHELPDRLSIAGAAGYLERNLHRVAQDDEQDFPLLAREIRKCRQHLEAVLHNDDQPDRGAPCPECASDRQDDAEAAEREGREVAWKSLPRLTREYAHWCEDEVCERFHHADDGADVWQCPRVRDHWWSHEDYARWIEDRKAAS